MITDLAADGPSSFALLVGDLPKHNLSLPTTPARSVIFYPHDLDRESYLSRGAMGGTGDVDFLQDHGQIDPFDVSWTIPTDVAIDAFCYFFDCLRLPDFVGWNHDF